METIEFKSPFEGTPWNSDQDIYDFASHKRYQLSYEWEDVQSFLTAEGLDHDYAKAIVENLKEQEGLINKEKKKRKWIAAGLSIAWAIIAILFIEPFSYRMSPECGRYIFVGIVAMGLGMIHRYRKGE